MPDTFWIFDPVVLVRQDNLLKFWPKATDSNAEKHNATLRFGIYLALVLYLYTGTVKVFFIPLLFGLWTLYIVRSMSETMENFEATTKPEKETCRMPTSENPYMNWLPYSTKSQNVPACDVNDPAVKREVDKFMGKNVYTGTDNWFNDPTGREFYTLPANDPSRHDVAVAYKFISGSPSAYRDKMWPNSMTRPKSATSV